MRLAVTADLHWGMSPRGDEATRALVRHVEELRPDAFVIAGDVGEQEAFDACLRLFSGIQCDRLVVPGNHDLWLRGEDRSSLTLYQDDLPLRAEAAGFHYLDAAPFLADSGRLAVVGSVNWYDYSFSDPEVAAEVPDAEEMYRRKLFPRGRHNDGRFVRLGMSDDEFTTLLVEQFQAHLAALPETVEQVVVVQHHPPVRELFYPVSLTTLEQRFWLAYTGNRRMQAAVLADPRVRTILCGHTHAACRAVLGERVAINVGGDYHFKRLLLLDTESGDEQAWEFGDPRR